MPVLCYQLLKRMLLLPAVSTLSYSVCRVTPGRLCFSKMAEAAGQTFQLVEVDGDLFTCPPTDGLVYCVSRDLRMSKGIAVLFKKKFGGVDELKKQGKHVGDVAVLRRSGRFIYYLITKERFFDKPTYNTLRSSLEAMKAHCQKNKVVRLSMPRIGCGLDRLDWLKVSELITQVFSDSAMTITVYTI